MSADTPTDSHPAPASATRLIDGVSPSRQWLPAGDWPTMLDDLAQRIERMIRDVLALGRREQAMPEALPLADLVQPGQPGHAHGMGPGPGPGAERPEPRLGAPGRLQRPAQPGAA